MEALNNMAALLDKGTRLKIKTWQASLDHDGHDGHNDGHNDETESVATWEQKTAGAATELPTLLALQDSPSTMFTDVAMITSVTTTMPLPPLPPLPLPRSPPELGQQRPHLLHECTADQAASLIGDNNDNDDEDNCRGGGGCVGECGDDGVLPGFVFMCSYETEKECLVRLIFGAPRRFFSKLCKVVLLFLFCGEQRKEGKGHRIHGAVLGGCLFVRV
jgi:hypothetical protein